MPRAKRRPRAPATRAGQGAGRGRCARRPCPPAGGPCSALGGSGAAETHARPARPPRPGPTRAWPDPPRRAVAGSRAPAVRIYKCARPAPALRSALCNNNTVSRVGNETWEENKAAGGGRGGGEATAREEVGEEEEEEEAGTARRVAGRGLTRPVPAVPAVPGARGSQVPESPRTSPRTLGRGVAVSVEPEQPEPSLGLLEELGGEHLERELMSRSWR